MLGKPHLNIPAKSSSPNTLHKLTSTLLCCSQPARVIAEIENTLKIQLIVSTVLMTPVAYIVATMALPDEFTLAVPGSDPLKPFDTKWVVGGG